MSMNDVYHLAYLLRYSGDRVLNGESKLSLTPALLHRLNTCFSQIATQNTGPDFHVIPAHGSQLTELSELDFLHDFVQKTPGLTISGVTINNGSHTERQTPQQRRFSKTSSDGSILDLSRFRQLHHLEVCGGTIESVANVSALRGHIRTLMLIRVGECDNSCDNLLRTVLAGCMHTSTDAHKDAWWPTLTQLVVSYCRLQTLGPCLSLAPRLVVLHLSHNNLDDESALSSQLGVLLNLRYLNLSFNRLTRIPELRSDLQYLIISHNRISYVDNVENLTSLSELNLVMNHLSDHSQLSELRKMASLQRLYLAGNPMCFHPEHRLRVCANLPRHAAQVKFLVDGTPFTIREKETILLRKDDFSPDQFYDPVSTVSAFSESSLLDSQRSLTQSFTQQGSSRQRRNKRVNNVVIRSVEDFESCSNTTDAVKKTAENSTEHSSQASSQRLHPSFETSTPNTSSPVISYAAQLMEERLLKMHPVNPAPPPPIFVRTIMTSSSNNKISTLPSSETTSVVSVVNPANVTVDSSTYVTADSSTYVTADSSTYETADSSTYETADISKTTVLTEETISPEPTELNSETITRSQSIETSEEEPDLDSDDEDAELRTYVGLLVSNDSSDPQEVFVTISSRYIKELETDTLMVRERWPLPTFLGCSSSEDNHLTLTFKSGNSVNGTTRIYIMEDKTAVQEVLERLGTIIEARNLSVKNAMKVIQCVQCLGAFSQEIRKENAMVNSAIPDDPLKAINRCPFCKSKVLVEVDENILSDTKTSKTAKERKISKTDQPASGSLQHSASGSSIGSAISLDSCSDASALMGSDTVCNPPTFVRRCESDIDIISNPSQSSIEVLEDSNRSTPGRKRSSEERQVVAIPSLLPVPESNPPLAGLTESSSSGSMTDSVCTAYENGLAATTNRRPASGSNNLLANNVLREEPSRESSPMSKETENDPFNAMLRGLLKAVGKDASQSEKNIKTDLLEEQIHYDYENLAAVDHRLKLHFYLSMLEEMDELLFILRSEIFVRNNSSHYDGVLVVSTKKVYILKITGPEDRDRIDCWLSRTHEVDRYKFQYMTPLPWMAGVHVHLSDNTDIILMLRDDNRTRTLLKFCKEAGLPVEDETRADNAIAASSAISTVYNEVEGEVQDDMHPIETVYLCSILIIGKDGEKLNEWEGGALHVGLNWIVITDDSVWCLVKSSNDRRAQPLKRRHTQPMSNLMKVSTNRCRLSLEFLDEAMGLKETWQVFAKTENVQSNVVNSLRLVWEPMFSVPLQVTEEQDDR